ncbi:hypothetical protein [Achromobacter piechaudii]|uniref:hypothetical protein n=1 Tax=Achromobacter piechaudii TaxID=72556 RepID=UPI0012E7BEB4|nr:hypothetical protein [Achromobacter piechaudii]
MKACSRPRTAPSAGGESRSGKKIPRPQGRTGSIPVSGTIGLFRCFPAIGNNNKSGRLKIAVYLHAHYFAAVRFRWRSSCALNRIVAIDFAASLQRFRFIQISPAPSLLAQSKKMLDSVSSE